VGDDASQASTKCFIYHEVIQQNYQILYSCSFPLYANGSELGQAVLHAVVHEKMLLWYVILSHIGEVDGSGS
jgi:hypothetical protein